MSKKKSGRRVWRGVTTATASLLALSVCASTVVDGFRTDIDKFLGTKSTKLVTESSDGTDQIRLHLHYRAAARHSGRG